MDVVLWVGVYLVLIVMVAALEVVEMSVSYNSDGGGGNVWCNGDGH